MKAKEIKTTAEAVTKAPEVKAAVAETAASVKTEEVKTEAKAAKTEEKPAKAEKKTTTRKATAKTTAAKAATSKAAAAKSTAKKEVKASITVQFEGKSYSQEELMRIAKDVWKFDLKKKVGDLKSVELYVKPEENTCYYVMNDEIAGSFSL